MIKVQTHLRPSNQLAHTYHTFEFWGVWVAEDTGPVLGKSRVQPPYLGFITNERTINRVRGHILKALIDIHTKQRTIIGLTLRCHQIVVRTRSTSPDLAIAEASPSHG